RTTRLGSRQERTPALSLPHDTVVDLLDGLDLFESLSSDEVDALARKVETVAWEPSTTVFSEGDTGDVCYVIHSGRVKLMRRLVASATSTVNGRILATLLAQVEARQARHPGEEDIELVGSPTDLARLAGAPKDAATRLLHWLENEGTITLKRGRIVVRSPAALRGHLG